MRPAILAIVTAAIMAAAQGMRFEEATVRRNQSGSLSGGSQILPEGKVIITNTPIRDLLRVVYDVPDFAIVGAPEWCASERYDITAQAAGRPSRDELKQMIRSLLAEHFKLLLHQERRSLPVFELRQTRTDGSLGPNLIPSKTSCEIGGTAACPHELKGSSFTAVGMPIARIVRTLAELAGRPIIDRTNLAGLYDINLTWTPGPGRLIIAVRDQLGLTLEPRDELGQVLVIDGVSRPKWQ